MGIWSTSKKTAKFFVSMPLSILGVGQIKAGNKNISDMWKSLANPVCPECGKGVLVMQNEQQNHAGQHFEKPLYPWVCNRCPFSFLGEAKASKVSESTTRYRNERVKAVFLDMDHTELERIARGHCLHSRVFFLASVLTMIGFFYMLVWGSGAMLAANWFSIAFALWVFGMKRSYRSWQVRTGHLFFEGAFWFWFKHEKWLI